MNSQKRLLLTLKYLWEKTDEEHPATLKEIGEYLQHNGIETTRKTLQADINLLTGFGIDIICNHSIIGKEKNKNVSASSDNA